MKKAVVIFSLFILVMGLAAGADAGNAKKGSVGTIDCSKASVPDSPVEVSINGAVFKPAIIKLRLSGNVSSDGKEFDSYDLDFKNEDDIFAKLSAHVTFLVPKGKKPDGKTLRRLPNTDTEKQPAADEGLPEVQSWSLEDRDSGLSISAPFNGQASLRIELGKRSGNIITGKINMCVPPGPDAGEKMSSVKGTFEAVLK